MMAPAFRHTLLQHLRRLIGSAGSTSVADHQLLERFLVGDEAAFELLVWRHGPMVLNVCVRVLGDEHEAEDVFQTVFVQLARKAGSIAKGASVGSWLYKVAFRSALRVRERAANRSAHEQPLNDLAAPHVAPGPADEAAWRELRPLLDAEVLRLPEKYRSVFILCCLQGMTNEQAALELGCPKGTVLSRLARAREKLRRRLSRRGLIAGLLLPYFLLRCGDQVLSADLVALTLQKATSTLSASATPKSGRRWTIGSAAVMVAALAAILGLAVSSAGAFFVLSPHELELTIFPPQKCSNGCGRCGKTSRISTAPVAVPQTSQP